MTRTRSTRVFVLALALAASTCAFGFTKEEEAILERDCSGDYLRHCAMFDPDSPQVEQCFKAKMRELSPACRTSIQAISRRGGRR